MRSTLYSDEAIVCISKTQSQNAIKWNNIGLAAPLLNCLTYLEGRFCSPFEFSVAPNYYAPRKVSALIIESSDKVYVSTVHLKNVSLSFRRCSTLLQRSFKFHVFLSKIIYDGARRTIVIALATFIGFKDWICLHVLYNESLRFKRSL